MPAFRSVGAVSSSASAITPALPTGWATNDILLLFFETSNQNAGSVPTGTGATWVEVTGSPQGTGTAGSSGAGTGLRVYWARATSTTAAPAVPDSGDHNYGYIAAYTGCATTGNPWEVTAGGVKATASTSFSATGVTTTTANDLIVVAMACGTDTTTTQISAFTNANLTGLTFRAGTQILTGSGGGVYICDGTKAAAGATGATTGTQAASSPNAFLTIALNPATVTAVKATGIGSAKQPLALIPVNSPALEVSGYSWPGIGSGDTINAIQVTINQFATSAGMGAPTFELWDNSGTPTQIGGTQTGTATTTSSNIDSAIFTGVSYGMLATLSVRIYAHKGTASTGAIQNVNWVGLYANTTPAVGGALPELVMATRIAS